MFQKQMGVATDELKDSMTLNELKAKWDAKDKWAKEHPFLNFIDTAWWWIRYGIWNKLTDWRIEVKYGFQRMFRGYDDRMWWGHSHENARQVLACLKKLQEHKHGAPYTSDPDKVLSVEDVPTTSDGVNDEWFKRWDEALQLMIEGFQAWIDLDDVHLLDENGNYDHEASQKERERLTKIWERGAKLYIANYGGLWD